MHIRPSVLNIILLLAALAATNVFAADYPTRPIRIVVPAPAGGTMDIFGRILADKMAPSLGQAVVIDNRPGAGTVIGTDNVAKSPPDGYSVILIYIAHAINPYVYAKLPYDSEKDFLPVAQIAETPDVVVVTPSLPVNSIKELIAYAKANPGKVNYGSAGVGTNSHLAAEMLNLMGGIKLVHVPYKGGPPANMDTAAGIVQLTIPSLPLTMGLIKSGKLKPIAVTSTTRSPALPNVAAVAETLPGFDEMAWYGLLVPARTPKPVVERLTSEVEKALKRPDVIEAIANQGGEVKFLGPEAFAARIRSETARWEKIVKDIGLTPGNF